MGKKILLALLLFLIPFAVSALDLKDAKAKGLVGEMNTGYLGAVSNSPAADVSALVTQINDLRRKEYSKIAKKNGTAVSVVEAISAKKAQQATPTGQFIEKDGRWVKK